MEEITLERNSSSEDLEFIAEHAHLDDIRLQFATEILRDYLTTAPEQGESLRQLLLSSGIDSVDFSEVAIVFDKVQYIEAADLSELDLTGATFSNITFIRVNFTNTILNAVNFDNVKFRECVGVPEHILREYADSSDSYLLSLEAKKTFLEHFEHHAFKYPGHLAIKFKDQTLTYQELDQCANQLARYLISLKYPAGSLIAILQPSGPNYIICQLAIWKAGYAFLNLNPTDPRSVLQFRLKDSQAKCVISSIKTRLKTYHARTTEIVYDQAIKHTRNLPVSKPDVVVDVDSLAYIIYTSGSSGLYKGVAVRHCGLSPCMLAHKEILNPNMSHTDVMAQLTQPSFDASLCETLILGVGGTLAIVPDDIKKDPALLVEYYNNQKVTLGIFTPEHLRTLESVENVPSLRGIFIVGEAFTKDFARQWKTDHNQIINGYGLTETTICVTLQDLDKRVLKTAGPPPMGRPIIGTSVNIIDDELYVSGKCLADGYIGHAEKFNRERFVYIEGVKHYKTGDKVSTLGDGTLVFKGRNDRQVKIRGQRIELDTIESLLLSHKDIKSAAVDNNLNCILVAKDEEKLPSIGEIMAFIGKELPVGVTLGEIEFYKSIPTTTNMKLNRSLKVERRRSFPKKNSIVAEQIATVWRERLGLDADRQIALEDNFYSLGGDSLDIAHLATEMSRQLFVDVKSQFLFRFQSLGAQIRLVNMIRKKETVINLISKAENAPNLFCIHSLLGEPNIDYATFRNKLSWNIYGVSLFEFTKDELIPRTIEAFAESYAFAIHTVQPEGPYFIAGLSVGATIAVATAQILEDLGHTAYVHLLDGFKPSVVQQMKGSEHASVLAKLATNLGCAVSTDHFLSLKNSESRDQQIERLMALLKTKLETNNILFIENLLYACNQYDPMIGFPDMVLYRAEDSFLNHPDLGWENLRKIEPIKGNHFSFMKSRKLIDALEENLNQQYRSHLASELVFHADYPKNFYIEPYVREQGKKQALLTDAVSQFLQKDYFKVMLIQGESGIGKTVSLEFLEESVAATDIPVKRISLTHFNKSESKSAIAQLIAGWPKKSNQLRLLLLDAYDEQSSDGEFSNNIYIQNKLDEWQNLKMIITCRSEGLFTNYHAVFAPKNHEGFVDLVLQPFDAVQKMRFIEHELEEDIVLRKAKDNFEILKNQLNMQAMLGNPLMLQIVLKCLPTLNEISDEGVINKWQLFRTFISKLLGVVQFNAYQSFGYRNSSTSLPEKAALYCEEVALLLYLNDSSNCKVDVSEVLAEKSDSKQYGHLQHACGNVLEKKEKPGEPKRMVFKHKSLEEYFTASAIISIFINGCHNHGALKEEVQKYGISSGLLRENEQVLHFIRDVLYAEDNYIADLKGLIRATRRDSSMAPIAGMVASLLVAAGISFNGEDLSKIIISDAVLVGGYFDQANFDGATLVRCDFGKAWLFGANLSRAKLEEISFGQWPKYDHVDKDVNDLVWLSKDNSLYTAVGSKITEWNTKSNQIAKTKDYSADIKANDYSMDSIKSIDISPDGKFIAVAGYVVNKNTKFAKSKFLQVIGCSGRLFYMPRVLFGHEDSVNQVHFCQAPGDVRLLSASDDGSVIIWAYKDRSELLKYTDHNVPVRAAKFSPNGELVASADENGLVHIWHSSNGYLIHSIKAHISMVTALEFTRDGKFLITGARLNVIKELSRDGKTVINNKRDCLVKVWNVETGLLHTQLDSHRKAVVDIATSPDGLQFATASYDETVRVWDARRFIELGCYRGHRNLVNCVQYSHDSRYLASGGWDNFVRISDPYAHNSRQLSKGHNGMIIDVNVCPDFKHVVSISWDHSIAVWKFKSGREVKRIHEEKREHSNCLLVTHNKIITGGFDGILRIRDINTGKIINALSLSLSSSSTQNTSETDTDTDPDPSTDSKEQTTNLVKCMTLGRHEGELITGTDSGLVTIWNLDNYEMIDSFQAHDKKINAIFYHRQKGLIFTASSDCEVRMFNSVGNFLKANSNHKGTVTGLTMTLDSRYIVSCSRDKSIQLWDYEKNISFTLAGHKDWVTSVATCKDPNKIVTGGGDNCVRLWDVSQRMSVFKMSFPQDCVVRSCQNSGNIIVACGNELYLLKVLSDKLELRWSSASHNNTLNISHAGFTKAIGYGLQNSKIYTGSGDFIELLNKPTPKKSLVPADAPGDDSPTSPREKHLSPRRPKSPRGFNASDAAITMFGSNNKMLLEPGTPPLTRGKSDTSKVPKFSYLPEKKGGK